MNFFITLGTFTLLHSCVLIVRGDGEISVLESLSIKRYRQNEPNQPELLSTTTYTKTAHHVLLKHNNRRSYSVLVNDASTMSSKTVENFEAVGIFILIRDFVGITVKHNAMDFLMKFTNVPDIRTIYQRHFRSFDELEADYTLEAVFTLDHQLKRVSCLAHGEAALYSKFMMSGEMETEYCQFFFYSKTDVNKLPAVMFITKYVEVRIANKPNHVILAVQAGNGAFYFGLIFASFHQARVFIHCLETDEFLHRFTGNNITEEIISKLFDGY